MKRGREGFRETLPPLRSADQSRRFKSSRPGASHLARLPMRRRPTPPTASKASVAGSGTPLTRMASVLVVPRAPVWNLLAGGKFLSTIWLGLVVATACTPKSPTVALPTGAPVNHHQPVGLGGAGHT